MVTIFTILFVDVETSGKSNTKLKKPNVINGLLTISFKIKEKLKK